MTKLSESPVRKCPLSIEMVALASVVVVGELTVRVPSSTAGEPPPLKVTVPLVEMIGARCTVALLLAAALARWPSVVLQLKLRLVPVVAVVAKETESSAVW